MKFYPPSRTVGREGVGPRRLTHMVWHVPSLHIRGRDKALLPGPCNMRGGVGPYHPACAVWGRGQGLDPQHGEREQSLDSWPMCTGKGRGLITQLVQCREGGRAAVHNMGRGAGPHHPGHTVWGNGVWPCCPPRMARGKGMGLRCYLLWPAWCRGCLAMQGGGFLGRPSPF